MENEKTVLVTGGSGFIGVETCKQLVAAGYQVINIDRKKKDIEGVTQYPFDIANSQVKGIITLTKPDAIIHLAADHEVERSNTDPAEYYWNNVANTIALLNHAAEAGVKNFIFSSTSSVYGEKKYFPTPEMSIRAPISPYSKTKKIIEDILPDYEAAYGMKFIVLRYFNAAGASIDNKHGYTQRPATHLIPVICRAIINQEPVIIKGDDYDTDDGSCIRDYTHVVDVARAHLCALEYIKDNASNTFNIGGGKAYSVYEVITKANQVLNTKVAVTIGAKRKGDVSRIEGNITKAAELLNWAPDYSLDDMINHAYKWELKQK